MDNIDFIGKITCELINIHVQWGIDVKKYFNLSCVAKAIAVCDAALNCKTYNKVKMIVILLHCKQWVHYIYAACIKCKN